MIIDYIPKYDEEVKDLLVELQHHISNIDKEGYNVVGQCFRDKYFEKTMQNVFDNNGKIMLYLEDDKVVGLIIGIIYNEQIETFDFCAPKRGRITELIVNRGYRGRGIGKELLMKMMSYLKSIDCQKILISVFGYNESALKFYKENGYHIRMIDMIED